LFIWIFNKAWLESLPEDLRATFTEVVHEVCANIRQETIAQETEQIAAAKANGIEFFTLSDEEQKILVEQGDAVHKKFADDINKVYEGDVYKPENYLKEVQQYMEDVYKLNPLPVFHSGEDFKWLKLYLDNYGYIGLGGLGQSVSKGNWILNVGEPAWNMICDEKGMPRIKVHGFAMTSPDLIIDMAFFSVDSTSWMQFGKYGLLLSVV